MLKRDRLQQFDIHRRAKPRRRWAWVLALIGILIALRLLVSLIAEGMWFLEVQYFEVFSIRMLSRFGLLALAFLISAGVLLSNLELAQKLSWGRSPPSPEELARQPVFGAMRFRVLLPLVVLMSLAMGIIVVYHGQVAVSHWYPRVTLDQPPNPVPINVQPETFWQVGNGLKQYPLWFGGLIAISVSLLFYPFGLLRAIALLMSFGFGVVISEQWARVLLYFNPTPFEVVDPLFFRDIGFYIFQLPTWELLTFWLMGLFALTLLSIGFVYLLSGNSLSQGKFPGFKVPQLRHLYSMGSCLLLIVALNYWLARYKLVYSPRGVTYGASFTDVMVQLPVFTALSIIALVFGLLLLGRSLLIPNGHGLGKTQPKTESIDSTGAKRSELRGNPPRSMYRDSNLAPSEPSPNPSKTLSLKDRSWRWLQSLFRSLHPGWVVYSIASYCIIIVLASWALPAVYQRVIVQPNELLREIPFIERTIALTRHALNLDAISSEIFEPQQALAYEDIVENALTVNNIRLWDARPLLETNRQLQRIRLYYEFPDADVDRYTITDESGESEQRQVLISARELEYDDLPDDAKTWVNEHLIYTHGFGFTMSPVNTADDGGLPDYFIRGIEHIPSSEAVRRSIPIGFPRIYYGELTDTYVMTQTRVRELDFPSGSENEYNSYDGSGGISIGSYWRRLLFSTHLGDWRMLLTRDFTPETRLLFRRSIRERIQTIAPFLQFDRDPYLVVADITSPSPTWEPGAGGDRLLDALSQDPPNYLYWIIDAYTTSNRYPYSDPMENDFNYIRNSVKVVVDAYNGTTAFFVADESDPIIRSWDKIFPGMFHPLSEMPPALQSHIRYPQDYYQVQSQHLMTYHMTDPQVFYNKEDKWRAPSEIYGTEQQVVEPYYLIMKLPVAESEEFILFRPFTPTQRRNMIAWLAARSDKEFYGTQLLYTFPKQELVFGPEQIEARINQDPIISQQISLWNREGSRAVQGNLLVIPIEESILYVEPLYLEADQNQLPTLVRVIVVYENQIVMAPTLEQALSAIFLSEEKYESPTILRSINGEPATPLDTEDLLLPDLLLEEDSLEPGIDGSDATQPSIVPELP